MATFYRGYRNVTKGRNSNVTNPYKNEVGVYSNWSIFNTSHVLDGAPDTHHVPGEGRHPHGLFMSRRFLGLDTKEAMDNSGDGARLSYARFRPLEYKGMTANAAMTNPGHVRRHNAFTYSRYSNFIYDGLENLQALDEPGHPIRGVDAAGTADTFGRFGPWVYKGTTPQALVGGGKAKPAADATGVYGHEHINEWAGVPSGKAL